MIKVQLDWGEIFNSAMVGVYRQIASLKDGRRDQHGFNGDDGWTIHIEGAAGETAVAKALNRYLKPTFNVFKSVRDVDMWEVRTRSKHDYDLIVRKGDGDSIPFILVTGRIPNFVVHGWIYGKDAKQDKWVAEYGGRPPAWFVPKGELNSLDTLP